MMKGYPCVDMSCIAPGSITGAMPTETVKVVGSGRGGTSASDCFFACAACWLCHFRLPRRWLILIVSPEKPCWCYKAEYNELLDVKAIFYWNSRYNNCVVLVMLGIASCIAFLFCCRGVCFPRTNYSISGRHCSSRMGLCLIVLVLYNRWMSRSFGPDGDLTSKTSRIGRGMFESM